MAGDDLFGKGGLAPRSSAARAGDDAGDEMVDASDDATVEDAGDAETDAGDSCETGTDSCSSYASGVFAIKTVVEVWWKDDVEPPIIDAGRSFITLFQKATVADACDDDELQQVELTVCGLKLPPYTTFANCNAYQLGVAESVWDEPTMPSWNTTGTISSFDLDGTLALSSVDALLGIDLTDDAGAWPSSVSTVTCSSGDPEDCFPDHDDDGDPGIPLSLLNIGTNYRTNGCGPGDQPTRFQGLPVDALLSTRAIDCNLSNAASCSITDTEFVDSMLPSYTVLAAGTAPPTSVKRALATAPAAAQAPRANSVRRKALDRAPRWFGSAPSPHPSTAQMFAMLLRPLTRARPSSRSRD